MRGTRAGRWLGLLLVVCLSSCGQEDTPSSSTSPPKLDVAASPPEFEPLVAAAASACGTPNTGDASARRFSPREPGPHKLVFVAQGGFAHPLNSIIPNSLRPKNADEIELVACVEPEVSETISECHYSPHGFGTSLRDYERKRQVLRMRIVSPATGASTTETFKGKEPEGCASEVRSDETLPDRYGPAPSVEDIRAGVIDRYVRVPECDGARPFAACLQCWRDQDEASEGGCSSAATPIELSTKLPDTPLNRPVELNWDWITPRSMLLPRALSPLYFPEVEIRWSSSSEALSLTELEGLNTVASASEPGSYSVLAKGTLPGPDEDITLVQAEFTVVAVPPGVIESIMVPEYVRAKAPPHARVAVMLQSRPVSGTPNEQFQWTWLRKPDGEAPELQGPTTMGPQLWWTLNLAEPGTYQLQLEYDNGLGVLSEPMMTPEFIAGDKPLVTIDGGNRTVSGKGPQYLYATPSEQIGDVSYTWTIVSKPDQSGVVLGVQTNKTYFFELPVDALGTFVVQVQATDSGGTSDPVQVTVTAE
jgi:hypothetical protein